MSKIEWNDIEPILDQILDLPKEERRSFVEQTYSDQPELKSKIYEYLHSITESEGWLEDPDYYKDELLTDLAEEVEEIPAEKSLIGATLGSYTIKKLIAEGGMGSVYLADRSQEDFKHQVAIKIIKNGKATPENINRFKREQRILARLNHPGIAQLYDGGITGEGFPYIIMEYIDGIPITEYCKKNQCDIEQKITLFEQVLEAVRNAHENLTIHRDLKPDNILINRSGKVKILDFGISKLLEDDEDLIITKTGSRLLTPRYAAPEQIKQEQITTATDIYSLGMVFYKLLTDADPFDLDNLTQYQVEQTIIHEEPEKPSENVSTPSLKRKLRGDLDAITLKSIRKEPGQRYRVANEFLEDLKNYKHKLPVSAHEDSFRYHSRKFLRRNKRGIGIAAGILLLIVTLSVFYTYRITEEKNIAESETRKALLVKDLLLDIFKANDPILADSASMTLPQLLENGTEKITTDELDPEIRVEMLLTLSQIYQNITQYDQAMELAGKSLELSTASFGSQSVEVGKSAMQIGSIEHSLGNYKKGKSLFKDAQNIFEQLLPDDDPVFVDLYSNLGSSEEQLNNYDSTAYYFERSLDIIESQPEADSTDYINILRTIARTHYRIGENAKGDSLLFEALEISERVYGENDIMTGSVLNDLALFFMTQAKYDDSRAFFNRALKIKDLTYGEKGHPNHATTIANFAVLEKTFSNFKLADSLFKVAIEMDTRYFGEDHPNVANAKSHLADIHRDMGNLEQSRQYREEALETFLDVYDPEHFRVAVVYKDYGQILSELGKLNKAEEYLDKAQDILIGHPNTNTRNYASLHLAVAENAYRLQQFETSSEHFEKPQNIMDNLVILIF